MINKANTEKQKQKQNEKKNPIHKYERQKWFTQYWATLI